MSTQTFAEAIEAMHAAMRELRTALALVIAPWLREDPNDVSSGDRPAGYGA